MNLLINAIILYILPLDRVVVTIKVSDFVGNKMKNKIKFRGHTRNQLT